MITSETQLPIQQRSQRFPHGWYAMQVSRCVAGLGDAAHLARMERELADLQPGRRVEFLQLAAYWQSIADARAAVVHDR